MKQLTIAAIAFASTCHALFVPSAELLSTFKVFASSLKSEIADKLKEVKGLFSVPKSLQIAANASEFLLGLEALHESKKMKIIPLAKMVGPQYLKLVFLSTKSSDLNATLTNKMLFTQKFTSNGLEHNAGTSEQMSQKIIQKASSNTFDKRQKTVNCDQLKVPSQEMDVTVYADEREMFEAMKISKENLKTGDSDSGSQKHLYIDQDSDCDSDEYNDEWVCDTDDDCGCCCFFDTDNDCDYCCFADTDNDCDYCCIIGTSDNCHDMCYFDAYENDIEKSANRNMPNAELSLEANGSNALGWLYSTVGNTGLEKLSSGSFDFIHSNALVFAAVMALL